MVNGTRGAGIDVVGDTELLEGVLYQLVVAVHHLLGGDTLFAGADGHGYAVFVATADEKHGLSLQTQVAHINIGGYIYAGKVSDMHRPVCVGQCGCH